MLESKARAAFRERGRNDSFNMGYKKAYHAVFDLSSNALQVTLNSFEMQKRLTFFFLLDELPDPDSPGGGGEFSECL